MENVENKLKLKIKTIKKYIFKISSTQILSKIHPENKNKKIIKKSCKEASNKKLQNTNYRHNWKILRMTFSKISKLKNYLETAKNYKFKTFQK